MFEFGQHLMDVGIEELGWKTFLVTEPQDMQSSQICMNIGCAVKQIPHFCHLCQTHSDDVARPNQMPCGTWSHCPAGVAFLHYPMIPRYLHTFIRTYIHTYLHMYIHTNIHGTSSSADPPPSEVHTTNTSMVVATRPKISIFCFIYKLVLIFRLRRTVT
jgi:hypothetical protein